MRGIGYKRFAELLKEDFEGWINFEGGVTLTRSGLVTKTGSLDDDFDPTYYTAKGDFSLNPTKIVSGPLKGTYALKNVNTTIIFRPHQNGEIRIRNEPGRGGIVDVPVDLPIEGLLQIVTPKDIIF